MVAEIDRIRRTLLSKGYAFFDDWNPYNVNIIGIRSTVSTVNEFDDEIVLIYRDKSGNEFTIDRYRATTDPGLYYLKNLMNARGCAVLAPGQYRGAYEIGKHRGQYTALVQVTPLPVYRDRNRDATIDLEPATIDRGIHGINIHRASQTHASTVVGKWSAGCQVIADPGDYKRFMATVKKSAKIYGNSFTYTLITSRDLIQCRSI